jgi:hypothetical protein
MVFFRVLWAEILKTKRTVALRMAVVTPAALMALMIFIAVESPFSSLLSQQVDLWIALARRSLMIWTALALPLSITFEGALMAGLEHAENQWKNLFALPVPRWTIYISKLVVVIALILLSTAMLLAFVVLGGKLLPLMEPTLPFATPIPWLTFLQLGAEAMGLAFLAIAIQQWVSVRWPSFTVAVGFGLVATVAGFVITGATARDGPEWAGYFPWTLPTVALVRPEKVSTFLLFSMMCGLAIAILGCWEFCRRDVQ